MARSVMNGLRDTGGESESGGPGPDKEDDSLYLGGRILDGEILGEIIKVDVLAVAAVVHSPSAAGAVRTYPGNQLAAGNI